MTERLWAREIDDDEGLRLMRIVRWGSGQCSDFPVYRTAYTGPLWVPRPVRRRLVVRAAVRGWPTKVPLLTCQVAKARRIGSAAAKCSNQANLVLTFTDPICHSDQPQRPSSTSMRLATDQVTGLRHALLSCPRRRDRPHGTQRRRSSAGARCCKRGHPSGAPILKPCKFAVEARL